MFTSHPSISVTSRQRNHLWVRWFYAFTLLVCLSEPSWSQAVSCPDGTPFSPTANITCQVPESGVFNFPSVNIPNGVTVSFASNSKNTPVTILVSGSVTIGGTINLDGQAGSLHNGGLGGPGGFRGGAGGFGLDGFTTGVNGDGPGGGLSGRNLGGSGMGGGGGGFAAIGGNAGSSDQNNGLGGPKYGTNTLLPLIGGSGGGGGAGRPTTGQGGSGGGGGGALLISSQGTITFQSGSIYARGGIGSNLDGGCGGGGGGGAGGAIRLVANAITGNPNTISVTPGGSGAGCGGERGGESSHGYVRIEAANLAGFNPRIDPNTSAAQSIITLPRPAVLPNAPQLTIASVAGQNAPATPRGSLSAAPDIIFTAAQTNPVNVVIQAANIAPATAIQVTLTPESGARTTANCALAGTQASSSCNASITLPAGMSVIGATTTIDLIASNAAPVFIEGERVRKMEVGAVFGGKSEITYITESGKRIKRAGE